MLELVWNSSNLGIYVSILLHLLVPCKSFKNTSTLRVEILTFFIHKIKTGDLLSLKIFLSTARRQRSWEYCCCHSHTYSWDFLIRTLWLYKLHMWECFWVVHSSPGWLHDDWITALRSNLLSFKSSKSEKLPMF